MNIDESSLKKFQFRINEGSVFFAAKGAIIKKAILRANNSVLSIIYPATAMGDECTSLEFFGKEAFHGKLAEKWEVYVELYVEDGIPILIMTPTSTLTWEKVCNTQYSVEVCAGSSTGPVSKTLIYTPAYGGYQKKART
jgi:hypothetical protein